MWSEEPRTGSPGAKAGEEGKGEAEEREDGEIFEGHPAAKRTGCIEPQQKSSTTNNKSKVKAKSQNVSLNCRRSCVFLSSVPPSLLMCLSLSKTRLGSGSFFVFYLFIALLASQPVTLTRQKKQQRGRRIGGRVERRGLRSAVERGSQGESKRDRARGLTALSGNNVLRITFNKTLSR